MGALKMAPTNDVRGAMAWWELKNTRIDAMDSEGPKVIFAGGSATLFGLSAARFQEVSAQPAFNFGLHANFGQELLVDAALEKSAPGDVVVWSPELSGLTGSFPTIALYGRVWELTPEGLWRILEHWFRTPPDLIARWPKAIPSQSVYHADAIGPLGDQLRNVGRVSDALCLLEEAAPIQWELVERILKRAKARDVRMVFRLPSIADLPCNDWVDAEVAGLVQGLHKRGILVLNVDRMRRPADEFYDTHYHMNQRGAGEATGALVKALTEAGLVPL